MADYTLSLSDSEVARYRMMAEMAQAAESDLWHTAGVGPGARVADIGCGPGAVTALLAQAVGGGGHVSAVDNNADTVAVARSMLAATGIDNWTVEVGVANATGLPAGEFDVVMIRHVLAHNGGLEQTIVEHAGSLLRPGGVLYLVDVDLTMLRVSPSNDDLADLLDRYSQFHRHLGNNPQIGLELKALLEAAGLQVVDFVGRVQVITAPPGVRPPPWAARDAMVASGVATAADVTRWSSALDALDRADSRPLIFPVFFIALGRRATS